MFCFGQGRPPSPALVQELPLTPPPSGRRKRKHWRNGSLTALLGSITPTSPRSPGERSASQRSSWSPSRYPPISRPISEDWTPLTTPARPSPTTLPARPPPIFNSDRVAPAYAMASEHLLAPPGAVAEGRLKQMREAKEMGRSVEIRAKRTGLPVPPYELLELIGKGSFGRVFKSRRQEDQHIVAVKIVDIDSLDYKMDAKEKDQAITDFINEIKVLHTLKDQQAQNINLLHEAFPFHSQLWIVSEYCPGGSVHTLMKAGLHPGLEEKYIITISRELAVALKCVHEAGIIHRDVKAANILITQDGKLQLCDFGVSGILEGNAAKRSTIIGTPFWMAPEMHASSGLPNGYGTEIDCWAYGCTVYELATGLPPNARIAPAKLNLFLKKAPRLEGDNYSAALREFVSFCLEERPENRPSADQILKHAYIADTSKSHPTAILRQLIERYAQWEQSGGQRKSLFNAYGARAPSMESAGEEDDSWNFSTTDDFARNLLRRFEGKEPERSSHTDFAADGRFDDNQRAARGGEKMGRVFDVNSVPYDYTDRRDSNGGSDLPLRSLVSSHSANRETIIDLDMAQDLSDQPSLDLADVPTIRANKTNRFYDDDAEDEPEFWPQRELTKRATREWKYPSATILPEHGSMRPRTQDWSFARATRDAELGSHSMDESSSTSELAPPFRPTLKHTHTEPIGNFNDFIHPSAASGMLANEPPDRGSIIDLDESYASSAGESVFTEFSTEGDAFDLENEGNTIRQRASTHMHTQSDPSSERANQDSNFQNHTREDSLSSSSEVEHHSRAISVKESVDSLRHATNADDFWDKQYVPWPRNEVQQYAENKRSLLSQPPERVSRSNNWGSFDSSASATQVSPIDPEMSTLLAASSQSNHRRLNLSESSSSARERSDHDRSNGAGVPASLNKSASSLGSQSQHQYQTPRRRRHNYSKTYKNYPRYEHRHQESDNRVRAEVLARFPPPMGPNQAALEDDAELEVVVGELERLLDDFLTGLRVTGGFLAGENVPQADAARGANGVNGQASDAEAFEN